MNNNLSDSNISDNTAEGDALYKQFLHDISTGSIDFQPFVEDEEDDIVKNFKLQATSSRKGQGGYYFSRAH